VFWSPTVGLAATTAARSTKRLQSSPKTRTLSGPKLWDTADKAWELKTAKGAPLDGYPGTLPNWWTRKKRLWTSDRDVVQKLASSPRNEKN